MEKSIKIIFCVGIICIILVGSLQLTSEHFPIMSKETRGQGTLNVEHYKGINSLSPSTTGIDTSNGQHVYLPNMYETLIKFAPNGTIMPCLATSWSVSGDGLTWTFDIRQSVKFHDNTDLDANAVKESLEKTITDNVGNTNTGIEEMWNDLNDSDSDPSNGIDGIVVVDIDTIQLITDNPAPMDRIAAAPAGSYVYSSSYGDFDTASYGTGPWKLQDWNVGTSHLILERFDDYWDGWNASQYDVIDIHYSYSGNYESDGGASALKAGSTDFAYIRPFDAPDIVDNYAGSLKVGGNATSYTYALYFNQDSDTSYGGTDVMTDPEFRKALSYAINYTEVIEDGTSGYAEQSLGPIAQGIYPHNDTLTQYDYNITKAREILSDAGYPNNETGSDYGWLNLRLKYLIWNAISPRFVENLSKSLQQLGIVVWDQPVAGSVREVLGTYDIYIYLWWNVVHTGYYQLMTEYGDNTSSFNFAYYDNQTFRDLCATGYENDSINSGLAEQKYYEAQEMLMNESVSAPLFNVNDTFGMRNEIMGFQSNPHYPRVVFFYDLYEVVIPEFSHIVVPMIGFLIIFMIVRNRKTKSQQNQYRRNK